MVKVTVSRCARHPIFRSDTSFSCERTQWWATPLSTYRHPQVRMHRPPGAHRVERPVRITPARGEWPPPTERHLTDGARQSGAVNLRRRLRASFGETGLNVSGARVGRDRAVPGERRAPCPVPGRSTAGGVGGCISLWSCFLSRSSRCCAVFAEPWPGRRTRCPPAAGGHASVLGWALARKLTSSAVTRVRKWRWPVIRCVRPELSAGCRAGGLWPRCGVAARRRRGRRPLCGPGLMRRPPCRVGRFGCVGVPPVAGVPQRPTAAFPRR